MLREYGTSNRSNVRIIELYSDNTTYVQHYIWAGTAPYLYVWCIVCVYEGGWWFTYTVTFGLLCDYVHYVHIGWCIMIVLHDDTQCDDTRWDDLI